MYRRSTISSCNTLIWPHVRDRARGTLHVDETYTSETCINIYIIIQKHLKKRGKLGLLVQEECKLVISSPNSQNGSVEGGGT